MNALSFATPATWRVLPASQFDAIAPQWDALNDAASRSPLLTASFVRLLLQYFGDGSERLALYGRNDQLDVAIVLGKSGLSTLSFQPSQAPIGLYLQRRPDALDQAALEQIMPRLGPLAALLGLMQLDPDLVPRPVDQNSIASSDYIRTARVSINGSFDDYWAARGKNLRNNMKKQRNKLDAEGIALRCSVITAPADVADGIADYGRLEAASWKAAGGTAITADNVQGRFYRALLEDYCARGMGRIYRCHYNEQVVAVDLCVVHAGAMVILKTTFDETIKGTSPAHLMRHEYLPGVFERREFERVEFYGRVMEWHTKWSDEIRTLYHVTAFRWPVVQRLYQWRQRRLLHAQNARATEQAASETTTETASATSAESADK